MNLFFLVIAFFSGAIPFGYLIVKKATGKDVRLEGSGNIGSTNVSRVAGKKVSILVQTLDVLKGLIPVLVYLLVVGDMNFIGFVALASILGHIFSPFLKFKGGKGINTTLGAFFCICPIPVVVSILTHISLKILTNIVSIRSIILSLIIPIGCILMKYNQNIIITTTIASVLIIFAHRQNIVRLINKEEI